MEKILFLLELISASWLTYQYPNWLTEITLGIQYGVACFFLLLPFLPNNPPVRPPKKRIKPQVKTRRNSRKGDKDDIVKAFQSCLEELQGAQSLLLLLRNHLGKTCDTDRICELEHQDLPGSSRNRGTAEAHTGVDAPEGCAGADVPEAIASHNPTVRPPSSPSLGRAAAKALQLPSLEYFGSLDERTTCHPQEDTSGGGTTKRQAEVVRATLPNSDVQKLQDIEITKGEKRNMYKEKGKHVSEYHLEALNMVKAIDGEQVIVTPKPFWDASIEAQQLPSPQKNFQHKFNEFFFGLPFLHSESLVADLRVSGSTLGFPTVLFNEIPNVLPAQMQAKAYPLLLEPPSLPCPETRFQPSTPTACQAQAPPLATVLTPPCPQPCGPFTLPFSPTHTSLGDESCPTVQNMSQSLIQSTLQYLECHILKKQQESESSLPNMILRSQEVFSLLSHTHPQDNQIFQTPRSDSILPGYYNIPEFPKQSQPHLQENFPQLQEELSNGSLEPQEKLPGKCQEMKQSESSCSTPRDKHRKNVKKTMPPGRCRHSGPSDTCCRAGAQLRNNSANVQGNHLKKMSKCNLSIQGSGNYCPMGALGEDSKELSDLRIHTGINAGNYTLRCPNKIQLENTLKVHLCRKVEQIRKEQIPAIVCRSWLTTKHALSTSLTHPHGVNLESCGDLADYLNTTQSLSFLNPGTQQVLDSHILRLRMRHRWCLPLKVLEPINLFKTRKCNALSFSQSIFPCLVTPKSSMNPVDEAVKVLGEALQADWGDRVTTKKSTSTLESPFADCWLTDEQVQEIPSCPQPDNDNGSSLALRQHFPTFLPSILGRTFQNESALEVQTQSLEQSSSPVLTCKRSRKEGASCAPGCPSYSLGRWKMKYECPSSRAKEIAMVKLKKSSAVPLESRDIFKSSVLAEAQTIDVDLRGLEVPGCTKKCAQVPEKASLTARVCSEVKLQVEVEAEGGSPCCPVDVFLQDCTTDVLQATDILASQVVQCQPQSLLSADKPVCQELSGFVVARASCQRQPKSPKGQPKSPNPEERLTRKRKSAVSTDKRKAPKMLKPEEHGRGLVGTGISQACETSQPVHDKKRAKCLKVKSPQLPPEKRKLPAEDHCKKRRNRFCQWISYNKKIREQGDPLQKGKPVLTGGHSHGPVKSKPVSPDKVMEAQVLMRDDQILDDKPGYQHEMQASVNGCSSSCRAPSCAEHRRVTSVRPCLHQAIPDCQSLPTRSTCISDVFTNFWKFMGFNFKSNNQALPSREFVSRCSSQKRRLKRWAYSTYPYRCPRHCLREYVLSGKLRRRFFCPG